MIHDRAEVFVTVVVLIMKIRDLRHVSDTYDLRDNISGVEPTKANIDEAFFADAMPRGVSSLGASF